MELEAAHRFARETGVSRPVRAVVKGLLTPVLRLWFRLRIEGREHLPADGPVVVAPNHKSFSDAFFVALATPRHAQFMAKSELLAGRFGWLLNRLGAFPVRRGESDAEALETARAVLRRGGMLALFPEGTRVRDPEALGAPKRGAARLALEAGAPVVPCAIEGTEALRKGAFVLPKQVQVSFGEPIAVEQLEPTPEAAASLTDELLWPGVEADYRRLLKRQGAIAAGLAALGAGGLLAARARRRRR